MSEREAPRLEPLARATRLGRRWPGGVGRVELDLERLYPLGTAISRSGRCSRHHVDEPYAIVGLLAPVTLHEVDHHGRRPLAYTREGRLARRKVIDESCNVARQAS